MIGRALVVWLLMMAIETIHGVLRNRFLAPLVGDFRARQIGVFIGSALILGVAALTIGWIRPNSERSLLAIGALWLALTLAFEFGLGRTLGRPRAAMLRLRPQPRRIAFDWHGGSGAFALDRGAHTSVYVDRTPMTNRDDEHHQSLVLKLTNDAVIPQPVAPQSEFAPSERLAELARIVSSANATVHIVENLPLDRAIKLAQVL